MAKAKPRVGDRINLPETAASPLPEEFFSATQPNGNGASQPLKKRLAASPGLSKPASVSQGSRSRAAQNSVTPPSSVSPAEPVPPVRRKATFRLSQVVLDQLAALQAQLQQEFGKADIPSREVMVEEAIAQFLAKSAKSHRSLLAKLKERQRQR